jgi:hypothetical protein
MGMMILNIFIFICGLATLQTAEELKMESGEIFRGSFSP